MRKLLVLAATAAVVLPLGAACRVIVFDLLEPKVVDNTVFVFSSFRN